MQVIVNLLAASMLDTEWPLGNIFYRIWMIIYNVRDILTGAQIGKSEVYQWLVIKTLLKQFIDVKDQLNNAGTTFRYTHVQKGKLCPTKLKTQV
jgi:hypothetical protein